MTIELKMWTLSTEAIETNAEWGQEWFLPKIDIMVREGVLVPDTRLQAIADAWNEPWQWGRLTQGAVIDRWAVLGELLVPFTEEER